MNNPQARPQEGASAQSEQTLYRDIIVIGASVGGVEALIQIVRELPADLPAAVLIVLHVPAFPRSNLPEILNRAGRLRAAHAVHGDTIRRGRIYIAPPDNHLMVQDGHVRVMRGPKENGHRPAVDPLFRTAARSFGARVIGVILTGARDCGSAGLFAVKALGGMAVVQNPDDAYCPDMPRSALAHVDVDHVVPLGDIAPLLVRLVNTPAATAGALRDIDAETARNAVPAEVVCPLCSGNMMEAQMGGLAQYRCHTGHVFSLDSLAVEQTQAVETALWTAVRVLQESETLARRTARGSPSGLAARFEEKAEAMQQHARTIQRILLDGNWPLETANAAVQTPPTNERDSSL